MDRGPREGVPEVPARGVSAGRGRPEIVGRAFELNAITGLFRPTQQGAGQVVLLAGEPGIGKTRLAEEVTRRAGSAFQVSWGRCSEAEGAPAFWPWTQILRSVIRRVSVGELRRLTRSRSSGSF